MLKRKVKRYRGVYERINGKIPFGWIVHHIDCNETNDAIENLIAMPERLHNKMHSLMQKYNKILARGEIEALVCAYINDLKQLYPATRANSPAVFFS